MRTTLAWDCATGNGQAARALAEHFDCVVASDASPQQIGQAAAHPRISFRVEAAESSSLDAQSADLVTVAQAYHWFDHDRFHAEARRVTKPGGVLAVWAYTLATVNEAVDGVVFELYENVLGQYWPPERDYIERNYQDFSLPWEEIVVPEFYLTESWNLAQMMGYLGTWSALRKYVSARGSNPLFEHERAFVDAWGAPEKIRPVRWPLVIRACRKPGPVS